MSGKKEKRKKQNAFSNPSPATAYNVYDVINRDKCRRREGKGKYNNRKPRSEDVVVVVVVII